MISSRLLALAGAALLAALQPAATPPLRGAVLPLQAPSGSVVARVLDAATAEPVVGAVVYLVEASGSTAARGLTNAEGRALLLDVPPGRYRLRAEMIGMTSLETEAFEAVPDAVVQRELMLEPRAIDIEGIEVAVEERCRVRPEEGLSTSRVWEEARKALEATRLTDQRRAYRYRTMMYERDLEEDARTVLGEERTRRVATLRIPFRSRPAAELVEDGFVEEEPDGDVYFGPDASVLLSDPFLDTHCFRLRRGDDGETEELLGLAFEPLGFRGEVVDISGTLWLEPETSELRWLEFRYENLDRDIQRDEIGGRVDFRRLPDGGWIVSDWFIRMPSLAAQLDGRGGRRVFVAGYREVGGMVLEVEGVGSGQADLQTGAVAGMVTDSLGGPAAGVRVEVVGADLEAVTGSDGRFHIDGLVAGTYRVRAVDPMLRAYGHRPEPVRVAVKGGGASGVTLAVPSLASVVTGACAAWDPGPDSERLPPQAVGEGVLIGRVVDAASGEAIPGATVRLTSSRYEFRTDRVVSGEDLPGLTQRTFGFEATADADGVYRFCRVPEDVLLTVTALHGDVQTRPDTVEIAEEGGVVEHTLEVRRR